MKQEQSVQAAMFAASKKQKSVREGLLAVFTTLKLPNRLKSRLYAEMDRSGETQFSLELWNRVFPDFPIEFITRSSEKLRTIAKPYILFERENFFKLIGQDLAEQLLIRGDLARPFGILLQFPNDQDWYILHTAESTAAKGNRLLIQYVYNDVPRHLVLEKLKYFAESVSPALGSYYASV